MATFVHAAETQNWRRRYATAQDLATAKRNGQAILYTEHKTEEALTKTAQEYAGHHRSARSRRNMEVKTDKVERTNTQHFVLGRSENLVRQKQGATYKALGEMT